MNTVIKQTLVEALVLTCATIGITGIAFGTVKLCTKIYGPIEVKTQD